MTRLITTYLVDDEPPALARLARLLEETGRAAVAGTTSDPAEALEFFEATAVDLAFFDIRMPGMTGIDLCARLRDPPPVVFTTAYETHALEAFEVHAIDYLLKPVDAVKLARALDKHERLRARPDERLRDEIDGALARMADLVRAGPPPGRAPLGPPRLASRAGERIRLLELAEITHIATEDTLVCALTQDGSFALDQPLNRLEEELASSGFVRVHRGALVNLAWIAEIHPAFAGRARVVLRDRRRTELDVSRSRVRALKEAVGLR